MKQKIADSSIKIERATDRNFGVVFGTIFSFIGLYLTWTQSQISWATFSIAAAFFLMAAFRPSLLKKPNQLWFQFGMLLGSIIAPVVMALVYISTIVPLGLLLRALGKDLLGTALDSDAKTYWIERETPPQPMQKQF